MYTVFYLGPKLGWVVNATPRHLYARKETRYALYRRLGGTQSRCGRVCKISPPPGFDRRTVHPVASRYTDLRYPGPREYSRFHETQCRLNAKDNQMNYSIYFPMPQTLTELLFKTANIIAVFRVSFIALQ